MKTVLLCGGYGTRIRDVADDIPKPMIPIGGMPILWHIMKYYAHFNFCDFVLCLGYRGKSIKDFFLDYDRHRGDVTFTLGNVKSAVYHNSHAEEDWRVTLADTGLNAMTGTRIQRIHRYVADEENFFLTYGDGVGDVDLNALLAFHKKHGRVLTVTGVRPPGRFGELDTDEYGAVTEFNEKPQASGGLISGGFFVCRRELFHYLDDREDLVFEQEPMHRLVADNQLMVYRHEGFWQPMDTYRDYSLLNGMVAKKEAPWLVWE